LGQKWSGSFRFVRTDYRTVTVNVIDRSASKDRFSAFLEDLISVGNESSLVFTAAPGTAQTLMDDLVKSDISYESNLGPKLATWIEKNYHPAWPVARGNERAIAIHHGRLPRSLGQLFVHLFNENEIKVLICTSTLIEGVNTSAANVFIYDKKINRSDFDFFSFANIRGRVGRMMRHFVGNAFLYHEPPHEVETKVQVPVLNDPGASTDYLVMNVDRAELSPTGRERQESLPRTTGLSAHVLREHGALGVELLLALRDRIVEMLNSSPEILIWSGFPDKEQRKAVAELALVVAHSRNDPTGVHTPGMIGWAWSQLSHVKTLPNFLRWFAGVWFEENKAAGVDAAFQFLQACEFTFPRTLAAVEAIVLQLRPDAKISYGPYIVGLETWFRPPWMKDLDEAGIPLPLAERLSKFIGKPSGRVEALQLIAGLDFSRIEDFDEVDRFIIALALS
jgi:helicase-like protein